MNQAPVSFQAESPTYIWQEALPIATAHFEEYDPHRASLPMDPDFGSFKMLEEVGVLRCYSARRSSVLLGYVLFTLGVSTRRKGVRHANQEMLHVARHARGRVTAALIRYAEQRLKAEGVKIIYHSCPMGAPLARLLELLGYEPTHVVHSKIL